MMLLGVAQRYSKRPSELLDIGDPYTAYCFDEACAYIMNRIDAGDEVVFEKKYKSFSDLYADYT